MKVLAYSLPTLKPLHNEVPLVGTTLSRGINQPGVIDASLDRATAYGEILIEGTEDTLPLIRERGTLLVTWDGMTVRSFIIGKPERSETEQDRLRVQGYGPGSLLTGIRWSARARNFVDTDPLDIVRELWAHNSSFEDMLTVTVDGTQSPIRVGEEEETRSFEAQGEQVEFDVGPRRLNWWTTTDMGSEFEDYADETPFEWAEETSRFIGTGNPPEFHIRLGYPTLEPRTVSSRFEVGLNVINPQTSTGDEPGYLSEVFVLGNGDGSAKRRGEDVLPKNDRLRTPGLIDDNSVRTNALADKRAEAALAAAQGKEVFWETVTVIPHPAAPVGTYDVGDIITVRGQTAWGNHVQRCRIIELTHVLETDYITLTLTPWQGG